MSDTVSYDVELSVPFVRAANKFFRKHPELRPRFDRFVDTLGANPFTPSLRTHALAGDLAGKHAASLTRGYRVIMEIDQAQKVVTRTDIGSHNDVYGSGDDD